MCEPPILLNVSQQTFAGRMQTVLISTASFGGSKEECVLYATRKALYQTST
jgi:hypothetical protein